MEQYTEAFVGIDTAKNKHALAIADSGGDGEIRYLGEIDSGASGGSTNAPKASRPLREALFLLTSVRINGRRNG